MLDYYGYISPSAIGLVSPQPKEATLFIKTIIVTIPAVLSAVSLFFKLGYPFLYKDQMDLVADGIGLHLLGRISYDPITAERYTRADNSYPAPSHHRADGDGQEEPLLRHRGAAGGGSGGGPRHHEHGAIMANAVNPQPSPSELRKVECMEHFHRVKDARDLLHGMRQENVLLVIAHFIESSRDSAGLLLSRSLSGIIATWHFFKDSTDGACSVLMTVIRASPCSLEPLHFASHGSFAAQEQPLSPIDGSAGEDDCTCHCLRPPLEASLASIGFIRSLFMS